MKPPAPERVIPAAAWSHRRAILLMLGGILAVFAPVLVTGRVFLSDNYLPGFPLPLAFWTDALYGGYPFLVDLAFGAAYPFRVLFSALGGMVGTAAAYNVFVLLAFSIAGLGTYGYVYEITASREGASAAGLAFSVSGFMQGHLGHETMLHTAAWLPVIVWMTHRVVGAVDGRRVALLAVAIALAYLGNHPEILLQVGVVSVAYGVFVALGKPVALAAMFRLGASWVIGIALVAWHFLPAWEYARFSQRANKVRAVTLEGALPFDQISQLALPWAFGAPFPTTLIPTRYFGYEMFPEIVCYVVPATLICAAIALIVRGADRLVRFWAVAAALLFVTALGPQTLLGELRFHAPGFSLFRIPARDLLGMHFASAVLCGIGLSLVVRGEVAARQLKRGVALGLLPTVLAILFFRTVEAKADAAGVALPPLWRNAGVVIPALIAAASAIALLLSPKLRRSAIAAHVGIAVVLGSVHFGWTAPWNTASGTVAAYFEPSEDVRALQELVRANPGRILAADGWLAPHGFNPNSSLLFGFSNVAGYGPLLPLRYAELTGLTNGGWIRPESLADRNVALDMLGVRWIVPHGGKPGEPGAGGVSTARGGILGATIGGACGVGSAYPQTLSLGLSEAASVSGIEIVTTLGCAADVITDSVMAYVTLRAKDGRIVARRPLSAGRETAEWTADCSSRESPVLHPPAKPFDSHPIRTGGRACNAHHYVAKLAMEGVEASTLEFEWRPPTGKHERANLRVQQVKVVDRAGGEIAIQHISSSASHAEARWKIHRLPSGLAVLENPRALPRAWLVQSSVGVSSFAEEVAALQSGTLPNGDPLAPVRVAVHSEGRALGSPPDPLPPVSPAAISGWGTSSVSAEIETPSHSLLVLSQQYYPGWTATVDGSDTQVRRVNGVLQAVEIPAGRHRVELRYVPSNFLAGLVLSIVSLGILGILIWRMRIMGLSLGSPG